MVRPMTTSPSSQDVPLCIETCNESPSIVAGPSSLASSLRGNSSSKSGSESSEEVLALKDRLQVTSGEETLKLLPPGSSENTMKVPAARRPSASSITLEKLSLSTTVSDEAVFFRKLRATSPRGVSPASSCARTHGGKASNNIPEISRANFRQRLGVGACNRSSVTCEPFCREVRLRGNGIATAGRWLIASIQRRSLPRL